MSQMDAIRPSGAAAPVGASAKPVLSVAGLTIAVRTEDGVREVVSDLNFQISRGETFCIAGESGSGKSMTSLAIMGLLPEPAALDRKSTRLNSSHVKISYAVFCLKKKNT